MKGGSLTRVRYVAEWVAELPAGRDLTVGDRVVCPHAEMLVRATAQQRLWNEAELRGEELVVALAPWLVVPGSSWRVEWMTPVRGVRWPSGTVYLEGGNHSSHTLPSLDVLADYADELAQAGGYRVVARASLSVLEPGEEGAGRTVVTLSASEDGVDNVVDAVRRLAEEAERRFGRAARLAAEEVTPGGRRVRFMTEWVEESSDTRFEEGERITVPRRELVVRRLGRERRGSVDSWWVSAEAEATRYPPALDLSSDHTLRGADVLADVGQGLVAPGASWHVVGHAHTGYGRQSEEADGLDLTLATLDGALDAVFDWADALAAWAEGPVRADILCGSAQLYAVEAGRDSGRLLVRAGSGGSEGLDAFLAMLEAFCEAAERRYVSEPAATAAHARRVA